MHSAEPVRCHVTGSRAACDQSGPHKYLNDISCCVLPDDLIFYETWNPARKRSASALHMGSVPYQSADLLAPVLSTLAVLFGLTLPALRSFPSPSNNAS